MRVWQSDRVNQSRTWWDASAVVLPRDCRQDVTVEAASHGWWCECGFQMWVFYNLGGLGDDTTACFYIMKYVCTRWPKPRHHSKRKWKPSKSLCLSLQVLPPFPGAEWSVLQCDGLLRPGEYAQVSVKAAPFFFFCLGSNSGKQQKTCKTGQIQQMAG